MNNNTEYLKIEEVTLDSHIYVITLNRPEQLNAINGNFLKELQQTLKNINSKKNVGALLINSSIMKAFCSGVDVTFLKALSNEGSAEFFSDLAIMFEELSNYSCPTIAVINGYAYGAGADLALACDFRIAGETSRFRFPGPQFGVVLGTHRLVNEIGASEARKLALLNQSIDAKEALKLGILHEVTENNKSFETALAWGENVINVPQQTFRKIRAICSPQCLTSRSTSSITKASVEEGDFNRRLMKYLERINKNKRK